MNSAIKGAIIVALVGPLIWYIVSMPDPVWISSTNTDNLCPQKLDFTNNMTYFAFTFNNLGQDKGNFNATVSSDEVLTSYKNSNQKFTFTNSKEWVVDVKTPVTFQFDLKLLENTDEPEIINIDVNLSCSRTVFGILKIPCFGESHTCIYQNQHVEHFGPDYELIN